MARRLAPCLLVLAVVLGACTGDGSDDRARPQILERPTALPFDGEVAPTPEPEGTRIDEADLEIEMCFNTYEFYFEQIDDTQEVTTMVDCRRPHDGEVYASYDHPAEPDAPYPGSTQLQEWSNIQCLQSFEDFVGTAFVESALYIGTVRPSPSAWTGDEDPAQAPARRIHCYVYAPSAQLSGPMSDSRF